MELTMYMMGEPVPQARPQISHHGGMYYPKKSKDYRVELEREFKKVAAGCSYDLASYTGAVCVTLRFYRKSRPTTKGDLDNYVKQVLDAMNGVMFVDDKQVVRIIALKLMDEFRPRVEVSVQYCDELATALVFA